MKTLQPSTPRTMAAAVWLRAAVALLAVYMALQAAVEFYHLAPLSGGLLGKFSWKWAGVYGILLAGLALAWVIFLAALFQPHRLSRPGSALIALRQKLGGWRRLLILLAALVPPALLMFTASGGYLTGAYLRLLGLIGSGLLIGYLATEDERGLIRPMEMLFGLALAAAAHLALAQLAEVSSYPFSLTWSEGNRLYDNSILFTPDRYTYSGELSIPGRAAGRYLLWGLPFLIPNAPIWVHRLWDALLATLPHIALGWLLARQAGLTKTGRWLFALWVFLFLAQGPIYTPLILSALLVAAFVRPGKLIQSMLAATLAGYYASLSRWTWLPSVPVWTVFIFLESFGPDNLPRLSHWRELLSPAFLRRLLPVALVGLSGLAGGLLANPRLFQPLKLSQGTSFAQPLLWYRLWPNATYPEGVLTALVIACAPAVAVLAWLAWSKRWKVSWLQAAAYLSVGGIFLFGGVIASVKIGGGNNLHNLDQFLVSLALLAGLALKNRIGAAPESSADGIDGRAYPESRLPAWVRVTIALAVLLPAWAAVRQGAQLRLPPPESTRAALETIRSQAAEASRKGKVLFLDQRQLLTFNTVEGVELVPEYELKYVMDQAMAGDSAYFEAFYDDLASRRFSLIVSDIQFKAMKNSSDAFGEENNAWVKWVSRPLLCYYTPVKTLRDVEIQLLVPKTEVQDCPLP